MAEGFSPEFYFDNTETSYYKRLGLDKNASRKDILKKFRNLAKLYHPDKTQDSSTEDAMKELNKMKSVLLDEVERRKYDEELATKVEPQVPLFMRGNRGDILLPPAKRHSEEFFLLFKISKRNFQHLPKPKFEENIKKLDQELVKISISIPTSKHSQVIRRQNFSLSCYEESNVAANRYSTVDFDYSDYKTIRAILKRFQKIPSSNTTTTTAGDCVHIMNAKGSNLSYLRQLLYMFIPEVSELATKEDLQKHLENFIPMVTIQSPPVPKYTSTECASCGLRPKWYAKRFGTCYWCSRPFCSNCPLRQYHYPRIGSTLHKLCSGCVTDLARADAEDWAESSIKFLAKTDDESIMASLGCASVAIALGSDSHDLLRKMARELHHRNKHELAYSIISLETSESKNSASPKQQMKAHHLASSILLSMAKVPTKTLDERYKFALASKEAYLTATSSNIEQDTEFSDNTVKEAEKIVQDLIEENKRENELSVLQHTMNLETFWMQRNTLGILTYLKEKSKGQQKTNILHEDLLLQAFQSFLKNKEPYMSKMLPEDRHALCFLKGVMEMKEKNLNAALADIEATAWSHSTSNIPDDAILGACIYATTDKNSDFYSFKTLKEIFQSGSKALLFSPPPKNIEDYDHSFTLLFPSDSELTPPFAANWPSLSVVGHNSMCHKKYEDAVLKLFHEKKWSRLRVAWAYLDEFSGCEHPAEMVACYLHAAMWIISVLEPNSRIEANRLYGLKCVVMRLLQVTYCITNRALNAGMELYVIRLSIAMIRKIAQMPNSKIVLSNEDFEFFVILLKRLEKVSRMFPFWNPPKVSVSEAVMFNIITRKLHSNFILGLQHVDKECCPLTSVDLNYQLYENDLRCLLPVNNPTDCRARAMGELLQSQGWFWNDVVDTMSSRLTLRDSDGWIIQSDDLGIPQQYSEIVGFVIDVDPDHPSLELLVVEANKRNGKIGLFSQEDINVMLQLESSDYPLYFSLDPPTDDLDKHYHPFQQWRYATEKVKGTEVLNTMFVTDYMMKSFTVGSDVSSLPPFHQRPTREGLLKNLPSKLQHALRSIHERGGYFSQLLHRFWIEAKEMKYDCQQDGSKITFYFGEMKMIVKSHRLYRKTDGDLDDTDEDDDPDSPEKQFAKDMTDHYEELGVFFPQFERLRQLSKLQVFAIILDSVLQNLKESAEEKNIELPNELVKTIQENARKQHHTNVTKALTDIKNEVGVWPKAEDSCYVNSKVNQIKEEMRSRMREEEDRLHRIYGYNVIIDNSDALRAIRNVEYDVREAIQKNDEETLNQLTRALKDATKMRQDHTLKQYVRRWLSATSSQFSFHSSTPQEELVKYVCQHLPIPTRQEIYQEVSAYHKQKYQTFRSLCSRYKSRPFHTPNTCKWVPAAISSEGPSITYGGVAFTPKVTPVQDGEISYISKDVTPVQIRQERFTIEPRSNSTYTTPTYVSYDKASSGKSFTDSKSIEETLHIICQPASSTKQQLTIWSFKSSDCLSIQLSIQFDKFVRGIQDNTDVCIQAIFPNGQLTRGQSICVSFNSGTPTESGWKKGLPDSKVNGIYCRYGKKSGDVYVGRSCDIVRRDGEHDNDHKKGQKTVGKYFPPDEEFDLYYFPVPEHLQELMPFLEQLALYCVKYSLGEKKVINRINAMSRPRFEKMVKELMLQHNLNITPEENIQYLIKLASLVGFPKLCQELPHLLMSEKITNKNSKSL